jgi:type I restriction enzyme S subunit
MNQTLEATARAIFKSWFVDFDPVRVKAEGGEPVLPDDVAALFPDSFEDSELGEIPRGWKVGVVSGLGNVICGKTPPTKDPENYGDEIPFITIPDMHGKVFVTQTGKNLSTKGANTQRTKYLPAKSVCVSCIATPGLVVMTTEKAQTNQQINSVIPRNEKSSYYCYQILNRLGDQIRAGGSGGSVLLNLNKTLFSNMKIIVPDRETVEGYQRNAAPLFEMILQNQRETATLATLRDTLLPKLISGELRVPDAEKFIEEAGL